MITKCLPFYELSLDELYAIMALRQAVFVSEQNCPFIDADGQDKFAWHMMLIDENKQLVAYTRLFDKNSCYEGYTSIGRVASASCVRGTGLGKFLLNQSIKKIKILFGDEPIKIGAQSYLIKFYQSFGFETTGIDYIEDGINHTYMIRPSGLDYNKE
jgi:ElaA protein